jgi:Subtilase family
MHTRSVMIYDPFFIQTVPVKVLDSNGEGAYDNIVAGIDYVIQQHEANGGGGGSGSGSGTKSVANLSLGGGYSDFLNAAIRQAVDAGVVMVVAAGNEDQDACNVSPASESSAITVGSSDRDDRRSEFSNWGGCVDIFAPGSDITSAVGGGGDSDTATMSGTSMASPHVAGAAALVLSADARLSAADVAEILVDMATSDALSDTKESPNKLLYVGDIQQDDGGNGRQPSDPSPPSDPQMPPPDDGDEDAPQMPPPPGGRRPADDDDAVTDDEAVMDDDAAFNPPPPSDDDVNRDQPQMPPPSNDDETPLFDDDAFFVPTPAPNDDAMPVAPPTAPVAPPPTAPTDDDEDTDGGDGDDDDAFVPTPAPNDDTMPVAPPPTAPDAPPPTAPDAPPPTAPDAPPPTAPDAPPPTAPANDDDVTGGGDDDVVNDDDDALTASPTLPPAVSPPPPPLTANATRVTFTVAFDTYREETTMDIWQRNDTDSHWLQLESCKPRVRPRRSVTLTLPNGYFSMDMHDSFGDGIDSGYDHDGKYKAGYFELVETDTGRVVHHGGKFKSYFTVEFETKDGVVIAEKILNW